MYTLRRNLVSASSKFEDVEAAYLAMAKFCMTAKSARFLHSVDTDAYGDDPKTGNCVVLSGQKGISIPFPRGRRTARRTSANDSALTMATTV